MHINPDEASKFLRWVLLVLLPFGMISEVRKLRALPKEETRKRNKCIVVLILMGILLLMMVSEFFDN